MDKSMFRPQGYAGQTEGKGLEICVWINSYIAQRSSMFDGA